MVMRGGGSDWRIAQLERRCELLASMLGRTPDDLDAAWPAHVEQKALLKAEAEKLAKEPTP
jgi:hypothetical protein